MKHRSGYLQCKGEHWEKQRMKALVRDDFTCQFAQLDLKPIEGGCSHEQPEIRLRFLHVHHKVERIHGGTHDLDNLLTICKAHHVQKHPHMAFEHGLGDRTLGDNDGWYLKEL